MYDASDYLFFGFIFLVVVGFTGLLGGLAIDGFQSQRSFAKRVACESNRGVARRQTFTTNVICIPARERQDTTTVNLNVKQ